MTERVEADQRIEQRCRYDLTIASIFQNEAPYLKEWIEFHRMIGVQRFVLVDDRSTDDCMAVLQPYIDAGEVEMLAIPCPESCRGRAWTAFQYAVLGVFCKRLRGVSRWLALIDVDELIVPMETDHLVEFLDEHDACGGVYVRWEPFGTSRVARLSSHDLMTERLNLKWKFIAGHDMLGKSIVKPHRVVRPDIHRCELVPEYDYVDSNPGMASESPRIKLHHYWTRDEHFLVNEKLPRTARVKGWELDDERVAFFKDLFNDVPDDAMKRFLPELRRRVFSPTVTPALPARASGRS